MKIIKLLPLTLVRFSNYLKLEFRALGAAF
jgi:hypothetical protein